MDECTPYINEYATRSLRDHADQDYIMSRIAYRNAFDQQFLWCAQQAIEKYLKAILLFNGESTKSLGHDLVKALKKVKAIEDLEFTFPSSELDGFVEYISDYGEDRYLVHPTHLREGALLTLDKVVWCIRRYCFYMRQVVTTNKGERDLFESNKAKATDPEYEINRHKYKIQGGYLEQVIEKGLPSYKHLVWQNFYYGKVKKHRIKHLPWRISSKTPLHALHPDKFACLEPLVHFRKDIKAYYEKAAEGMK